MNGGHPERSEGPLNRGILHTSFPSVINRPIVTSFTSFRMIAQRKAE